MGYDADAAQVFVIRGLARGFAHHFFTDKFSASLSPGTPEVDLRLVFNHYTLEVLTGLGEVVGSLLHL